MQTAKLGLFFYIKLLISANLTMTSMLHHFNKRLENGATLGRFVNTYMQNK